MKKIIISSLGALALVAGGNAIAAEPKASDNQPSGPGRPEVSVSNMAVFPAGPEIVGASILTRYNSYVDATVSTTGLEANGAYSWWWVVFNRPQFCVGGCGLDDLPVGATPTSAGDPRVQASLLWGGGFVANGSGAAQVEAHLDRNKAPGEVRFGPGLKNSRKAELHIVLRKHGPALAGQVADQISRFNGGCTDDQVAMGMCTSNGNVQFAAHTLP